MLDYPALLEIQPKGRSKENRFKKEVINDLWICLVSREASLLGRREVLTGKAKFGILGDGKEVPQVAMARYFGKGDFRSGYYRDQTFMFALGLSTVDDFFAQLYADVEHDPFTGGRQMNSHYASRMIDDEDQWIDLTETYNISADISSTAGQMARALGLALSSKLYRNVPGIKRKNKCSNRGKEVCFCTIGDASTSEGVFWETMNAASVMQVPLAVSVWDDGYGISVPIELQTTKGSISRAMEGFMTDENGKGLHLVTVKGWDYPSLCATYERVIDKVRTEHTPALIHVQELTQPQGHSTSGSHERYKSAERLQWEREHDCIERMIAWMLEVGITDISTIEGLRSKAKEFVRNAKKRAWERFCEPTKGLIATVNTLYESIDPSYEKHAACKALQADLNRMIDPVRSEVVRNARRFHQLVRGSNTSAESELRTLITEQLTDGTSRYARHLYSEADSSALNVPVVEAAYAEDAPTANGYQILNRYFDGLLKRDRRVFAFGEDVGQIGDVNQGFAGLQAKYGTDRVFDTGIREWTIVGQAIGMAMRGLRPIAEIQYLDYLVYGLTPLTDDLATLRYRSDGQQMAPAIIRTRGHRLEGIWHAGSPMGMLIHALRGMYILVPRNMVQAAGMYNTMIQSTDPALIVECLNGYRLKERVPENLGEYTVPLGVPEVLIGGSDVTLVTYGSCVRVAARGVEMLRAAGISVELIDVQSLLPFDLEGVIIRSLQKTNRIVFMDEDVPGGATAFMMQHVMEEQNGYRWLDSKPLTLTAAAHRPPYGSDGDYFAKPNAEDVYDTIYRLMQEADPQQFPSP